MAPKTRKVAAPKAAPKAAAPSAPAAPGGPAPSGPRKPSKQTAASAQPKGEQFPPADSDEGRAQRLKALGNTFLKLNRVPRAVSAYLAADATTTSNDLRITLASSLAAAMIEMFEPARAREFVDRGLRELGASGAAAVRLRRHEAAAEKLEGPDFSDQELKVLVEQGEKSLQEADFISAQKAYSLLAAAYKQDEPPPKEEEENAEEKEGGGFSLGQVGRSSPAPDKDGSWLAAICRVALTNLKLEMIDGALEASSQGLAWADEVGPINNMTPTMCRALRMRKAEANLLRDVVANYQASLRVTRTRPTAFTPLLAEAVFACNAGRFFAGQFLEAEYTEPEGEAEEAWLQKLCVKKKYGMKSSNPGSAAGSRLGSRQSSKRKESGGELGEDEDEDDDEEGEEPEKESLGGGDNPEDMRRQPGGLSEDGRREEPEDPEGMPKEREILGGGDNPEDGEDGRAELKVSGVISDVSGIPMSSDRSHQSREDGQDAGGDLRRRSRRKRTATPSNVLRPRRFLVTVNAVTSIIIFAWARCPGAKSATRAFGAHLPLQALLHGLMRRQIRRHASRHPLEELARALHAAFKGIPADVVEFNILGGHMHEDANQDSSLAKVFFPEEPEKQRLSWHVLDALREAGFTNSSIVINDVLLNAFPGRRIGSQSVEQEVMRENQYFACAALDVETGNIVTQTEHPKDGEMVVPPNWRLAERENSVLYDDNTMQPMRRSERGDEPINLCARPPVSAEQCRQGDEPSNLCSPPQIVAESSAGVAESSSGASEVDKR